MTRMRVGWGIVGAWMSMSTCGILAGCGGASGRGTDGAPLVDAGPSEAGKSQLPGDAATDRTAPATTGNDGTGPAGSDASTGEAPPDSGGTQPTGDAGRAIPGDVPDGSDSLLDASGSSDASRFITGVVQFNPTSCTGFGASSLPGIVEGPPVGGGSAKGSTDVVSLGSGGSIVVTFAPNAIVDGPGPDFIVFENPFWVGGNSDDVYAEPGEVSASDDGETWMTFPCTPALDAAAPYGTGVVPPYGACAGSGVVYSTPENGISPFDPSTAGGNAYDLADIGVTHARFVRIVDRTEEVCPEAGGPTTNGFDLDAIAIINAELP
jgi:hypothetical protein